MGLTPGNVFTPLGALMACMLGRRFLSARPAALPAGAIAGGIWASPYVWFLILCWTVAAPGLFARTFSLQHRLALGVVVGPMPITGILIESAALGLLSVPGLLAASFWSSSLHPVQGSETNQEGKSGVDYLLRWGETALAASVVAAPLWGPSLGALVLAPVDGQTGRRVAVSFGITCIAVATASFMRRHCSQPRRAVFVVCAGLSLWVIALAPVLQ